MRASLILSVFLIFIAFDDMMMVHDAMLTGAGIPEEVALGAYVVVGVVLIAVLVRPIRSEGLGLCLLAALGLLGASLGGDIVESVLKATDAETAAQLVGYAEDAVKFIAYAAFCHLAVLLARRVSARTLQSATERAAREAVERAQAPAPPRGDAVDARVAPRAAPAGRATRGRRRARRSAVAAVAPAPVGSSSVSVMPGPCVGPDEPLGAERHREALGRHRPGEGVLGDLARVGTHGGPASASSTG